ncbi:MAG TPA: ribosome assembly RNA-binding protein YhbY [Desulfobacterales bacterium]
MSELKGTQRKYLRGLAHGLKPVVMIGQHGLTDAVIRSTEEALLAHELIKVKFNACKEKEQKAGILSELTAATGAQTVGQIGHTAVLYRQHPDMEKRHIRLPAAGA